MMAIFLHQAAADTLLDACWASSPSEVFTNDTCHSAVSDLNLSISACNVSQFVCRTQLLQVAKIIVSKNH